MAINFEYNDLRTALPLAPAPVPKSADLSWYVLHCQLFAHALPRRGAIHLGGHRGESDVYRYSMLGFRRVLMVEPLADEFASLSTRCAQMTAFLEELTRMGSAAAGPPTEFECVQCAAAEQPGRAAFYRTSSTVYSSLMKPASTEDSRFQTEEIEVDVRPLDEIVQRTTKSWRPENFDYLRMNIQGGELAALKGAEETLRHLKMIVLEVNLDKRYQGQPTKEEFDLFLGGRGFDCTFGIANPDKTYANLMYTRARPS